MTRLFRSRFRFYENDGSQFLRNWAGRVRISEKATLGFTFSETGRVYPACHQRSPRRASFAGTAHPRPSPIAVVSLHRRTYHDPTGHGPASCPATLALPPIEAGFDRCSELTDPVPRPAWV